MDIFKEIKNTENREKAKLLARFFKTGKGEYGEGDIFLGIMVPQSRIIAKKFKDISNDEIQKLLDSKIHEQRLIALLILIEKLKKESAEGKKKIYSFYLKNTRNINNWDLVDLTAPRIVGNFLLDKNREVLYSLAKSKSLWERRIAIISTFAFIKYNQLDDTFKIAEILLKDTHDLIHKAVGWALREAGKKNPAREKEFLLTHYSIMPRTMLRYAIEKFNEEERKYFLNYGK